MGVTSLLNVWSNVVDSPSADSVAINGNGFKPQGLTF